MAQIEEFFYILVMCLIVVSLVLFVGRFVYRRFLEYRLQGLVFRLVRKEKDAEYRGLERQALQLKKKLEDL